MRFEEMWAELAPVGRVAGGGYHRQPWTSADAEVRAWFAAEAARRDLVLETDGLGTQVAWWRPEGASGSAVLTGSHLDSVRDGGAFDGPLGVVSALAAIDLMRERGLVPGRPLGVVAWAEEEGSRFDLACLGSRLAAGAAQWAEVRERRDADGVRLGDAVERAGHDPETGFVDLGEVGCFLELHVEQGKVIPDPAAPVAVGSGIWPHGRWRFTFDGEANHAGATAMEDRHDPMLTYAMTALAAAKQARLVGQRATFGRVETTPNTTNVVPSQVRAWLDVRCETDAGLVELRDTIERQAQERGGRDGTTVSVATESSSGAVSFDADLTARVVGDEGWPVAPSIAGHDAGILAVAGVPTAMLFVRNPTGVSHAPAEHAETADCLAGVEALAGALGRLTT